MIHLDTNLLIASISPHDPHSPTADRLIGSPETFATSACAWTEFKSWPVDPSHEKVLLRILIGGVLPFDEKTAALAGELFHLTGSKRRTRLDTMIAATAILAGAALATTNPDDFQPFVPHGLRLHPL